MVEAPEEQWGIPVKAPGSNCLVPFELNHLTFESLEFSLNIQEKKSRIITFSCIVFILLLKEAKKEKKKSKNQDIHCPHKGDPRGGPNVPETYPVIPAVCLRKNLISAAFSLCGSLVISQSFKAHRYS